MKPICVPCKLFYRVKTNGFYFEEGMPGPGAVPRHKIPIPREPGDPVAEGEDDASFCGPPLMRVLPGNLPDWQPYKLWVGDLWECRGCGHQLISGTGQGPVAEHYQEGYEGKAQRATIRIDDC